jgi:hypothetical protein
MAFTFRDGEQFLKEVGAVTGASVLAGTVAVLALPPAPASAAGAAALFGGSIAAAVTRTKPMNKIGRALLGVVGGGLAAFGFLALANAFGLGLLGMMVGGALGGFALGSLLGAEDKASRTSQVLGVLAAGTMGVVGTAGIDNVARFVASENLSGSFATVAMAGLLGMWITAAAGLRRVERVKDPLVALYDDVMDGLADPLRAKVKDAHETFSEIEIGIKKDAQMSPDTAAEAHKQARRLLESVLETAKTWKQIHADVSSPRLAGLDDKLKDLEKRIADTTDSVTQGHLQRAAQALAAQKAAVDGLKVGCGRAEAALDAQAALLERLRLAVAQHRVSDRERFAVEVSAVADQVSRLSDDLESLSAAIAEAEAFADRKVLADLERAGRRALSQLDGNVKQEETVAEKVEEPVVH